MGRRLERVGSVLALILAFCCAPTVYAGEAIKLRVSTAAVDADWHAQMLFVFEQWLERSMPEVFDVEVHLNATLFKQGTETTAMQRGNLDMGLISAQDISKQIPAWSIFTAGYLIRDPEHQGKVFSGAIGKEMYAMVRDQMGLEILSVAYLGTRQLNLRHDRRIQTPSDLAGTKLRMPGSKAWQFLGKALGANPTPLAFAEVYTALQTGAVDGQDNPLPTNKAARFYEVTKQIVLTSHLVDGVFLAMSSKTWDRLTAEQREVVLEATRAGVEFNNQNRLRDEAELANFFESEGLAVYSPDVEAFRAHVQGMYLKSEFSQTWPAGLLEQINAVR